MERARLDLAVSQRSGVHRARFGAWANALLTTARRCCADPDRLPDEEPHPNPDENDEAKRDVM